MPWVYLLLAGALEVVWAAALKQSDGFTRLAPGAVTIVAMIASIVLLSLAMKSLPLGTAYAIWTGIGALGSFLVGIAWLGEAWDPMRIASACLILVGLIGLKLASPQ